MIIYPAAVANHIAPTDGARSIERVIDACRFVSGAGFRSGAASYISINLPAARW